MAKLEKLIDSLTGKTEETQRKREQYDCLMKMARAKSETFENRLRVLLDNKEAAGEPKIVGDEAFEYHSGHFINISRSCDASIAEAVDECFRGGDATKECFCTLVKRGLYQIINDASIGEAEDRFVLAFPENGSIVRVDVMVFKYTFSSTNVVAKDVQNVFAYTIAKSVVDHRKVGLDYLMYAVVDAMLAGPEEEPDLEAIMPFIKKIRSCWMMLNSDIARGR